jgi:hypothetical protein
MCLGFEKITKEDVRRHVSELDSIGSDSKSNYPAENKTRV